MLRPVERVKYGQCEVQVKGTHLVNREDSENLFRNPSTLQARYFQELPSLLLEGNNPAAGGLHTAVRRTDPKIHSWGLRILLQTLELAHCVTLSFEKICAALCDPLQHPLNAHLYEGQPEHATPRRLKTVTGAQHLPGNTP